MIAVLPIPPRYMTSTARVRVPQEDAGGHLAYAEPVTIGRVRYELAANVRATDYQLQDGTTGVLFIDAVTSVGAFELPAGSLVSVDGAVEACVSACRRYDAGSGTVHHWEVELR